MAESAASRLTVLERALTLVTALLALGTGVLTYMNVTTGQAKDQAQEAVTETNSELSSLEEKYAAVEAENTRLRAQLGLPGLTAADPHAPAAAAATVRHRGQLVLANGRTADLDSPSSDPQWDDGFSDISYAGSLISPWGDTDVLYLKDQKADYETCRNTTGYSTENLSAVVGTYICVKTGENRYSVLHITQLESSKVTLEFATYDPPDK